MEDNSTIVQLTRAAFLSSTPPSKWTMLLRTLQASEHRVTMPGSAIVGAILGLYSAFESDLLVEYLRFAILNGLIDLSTYLEGFLVEPVSHSPSTYGPLAQLALDIHFATQSVLTVPVSCVQCSLAILRSAFAVQVSPYDRDVVSISQLCIILLASLANSPPVSPSDAAVFWTLSSDLLQVYDLPSDMRAALETFTVTLGTVLGGDSRVSREGEQTVDIMGKEAALVLSGDLFDAGISLMLNNLIAERGTATGCGNSVHTAALLAAYFRTSCVTPATFNIQMIVALLRRLSTIKSNSEATIVTSFISSRLPGMFVTVDSESSDFASASTEKPAGYYIAIAIRELFERSPSLLDRCDTVFASQIQKAPAHASTFRQMFIGALLYHEVITQPFANTILSGGIVPQMKPGAMISNAALNIKGYLAPILSADQSNEDPVAFAKSLTSEYGVHGEITKELNAHFSELARLGELERLSRLSRILSPEHPLWDVMAMHVPLDSVVARCLIFLEDFDCETVGDPQSAITHLGSIVLLVQGLVHRFQLKGHHFKVDNRNCNVSFLRTRQNSPQPMRLRTEDGFFTAWVNAIFDKSSEGIEDSLLRNTKPLTLLELSPSLVSYAIIARQTGLIDQEAQRSGISYFLGGLLNWTLAPVINMLISEIQRHGYNAPIHFEILQALLQAGPSPNECPLTVRLLCAEQVHRLLSDRRMEAVRARFKFNAASLRMALEPFHSVSAPGPPVQPTAPSKIRWPFVPRSIIQKTLKPSIEGGTPSMNVMHGVRVLGYHGFLNLLWSELKISVVNGDLIRPRQLGLVILSSPLPPPNLPLLPIFIQHVLPSIAHQSLDQPALVDLLVALVASSLLMTMHYEKSLPPGAEIPSPSAMTMARSVSDSFKASGGTIGQTLLTALASFPSFTFYFSL